WIPAATNSSTWRPASTPRATSRTQSLRCQSNQCLRTSSPYQFCRDSIRILLAFQAGQGDALGEEPLRREEDDDHGELRQERDRHHLGDERGVLPAEQVDAERQRVLVHVAQEDE